MRLNLNQPGMNLYRTILTVALALMLTAGSPLTLNQAFAQKSDKPAQPKLGPPPTLKLPPIQHFKLSNGLEVVMLEKHDVPLIQIDLVIRAGSALDPAGKKGVANMMATMMEDGAGNRNALQLADAIDFLGADISASAGQHTSGVRLHAPLSKLDSALAIFADIVLRPTFPAEELERRKKERLTTLMQWHDEPRAIASVIFSKTLFGTSHPYGVPTIGDEKTIRSMTVDDLIQFHAAYFKPNNGYLLVSGDVSPNVILPKLEAALGKWPKGDVTQPQLKNATQVEKREIYLVDKPGAEQSEIRIGRIGVQRLTDDFFPLLVMNTILGGSFTSRLNQNLREQHGYSYGAGSSFDFRPTPGPFVAAAAVQTDVTDKALTEFMKELRNILKPVTDDELNRAKNYVALSYPQEFQTVAQLTSQLSELVVYGLPDDYFNNYIQKILAVTKKDVERVAKKYLDPEKVAIIVVGDRQTIEPGITALKLGPIHNLTITDVLGAMPAVGEEQGTEH